MNTKHSQYKTIAITVAMCTFVSASQAQSFSEVVQNALAIYPLVQSAKAKTEAARADIGRARAAHYPQISYGYSRNSYANGELPASVEANTRSPSVRLNLWSGGRIEADARRAEALTEGNELQEAATRDDVALLASEAYINWARAIEMFKLATKNFESHSITLNDIRKIVAVDTGRQIDLQQAQVRMDNAALTKLQRQTELNQARQRLSRFWLAELPRNPTGLKEALSAAGRLGGVPKSEDQLFASPVDDLPVVAQQLKQVKAAQEGVSVARGQYWPTLDYTATQQLNLTGLPPYKRDTFSQVQLNMPLYSGGATSAQVDTAVAQLKAAQFALDEVRLVAREKAAVAYHEWTASQARAAQGVEQARVGEQVVDGYRQQFRLGRRQLLDLLNIQAESFGYQSSATTAFYDEQIARVRMLAAMGDLAKRF
jgi:adhesin transport system outer membrane protein